MTDPDLQSILDVLGRLRSDLSDERAWTEFRRATETLLDQVLKNFRVADEALREDLIQEVYLRLHRYPRFVALSSAEALKKYLWTVCANVFRSYLDKTSRRLEVTLPGQQLAEIVAAETAKKDSELDDVLEALAQRVGGLTPDDRALLHHLMRGATLSEIASQTDQKIGTIGARIFRLRRRISDQLGPRPELF